MFRKLVSNLPFSPALVGQLGFYVKRLSKEEVTRRLGLIFTAMAIVVQSFAVFSPPEQALASSRPDIIPGGISSVQQILDTYDAGARGQNDFKDLMDYMGINRDELESMNDKVVYVCSTDDNKSIISFGRRHNYSAAEGELVHNVPRQTGGFSIFYSVPLYRFDSVHNRPINCYDSYVGHSEKVGWFAIMRKCGNVQIKKNIQKFPKGHFISATCKTLLGYAYDERQLNLPVSIYLYFDGQPGKGRQYGPITANLTQPTSPASGAHGFSFSVPEEYQKSNKPVSVWAVMQPLPGWNLPTVQFDNTVEIPGNCLPSQTPITECSALQIHQIDRTRIRLDASARADEGTSISSYTFTVVNKEGHKVHDKTVPSTSKTQSSEVIQLSPGEYTAKVVVKTSLGDRESPECSRLVSISQADKCPYNGAAALPLQDPDCKPCPYNDSLWIKDPNCNPTISLSKEARNLTQQVANANGTTAKVSDRIEFTIYTTNTGSNAITTLIEEDLGDVLEYARLIDAGGGSFNEETKILSWGQVPIAGQQTEKWRFTIQVNETIPQTPQGANNPAAYNCIMTNAYGNTIDINVNCPPVKAVESAVKRLPETGVGANIAFGTGLFMVVTYFFARSRQLKKEMQLIRKDYNGGSL
ncbi:MAG TPA: hypothetical protein VFT87_04335 [Candidatus Saccharimonadales bacterium]|nr:hypothetical protein [Candidatus Saccharimonadales bacterium]